MDINELVPLTNGLSVIAGPQTFVCDRARITPVRDDAVDVAFWIPGTDFVPRLRLSRDRIAKGSAEELAALVRRVVRRVVAVDRG